jgi:hypothetical protein
MVLHVGNCLEHIPSTFFGWLRLLQPEQLVVTAFTLALLELLLLVPFCSAAIWHVQPVHLSVCCTKLWPATLPGWQLFPAGWVT